MISDNKLFKYITSKCLSSKSEVLILSLFKIGYKDGRIGGLSCDVDEDFEKWYGISLQLAGIDTRSFSDQLICSITSVDIE